MSQLTFFLIDDDPDDREIFTIALQDLNPAYNCITAKNGLEAQEKLKNDPAFIPDFIFLDLNMPLMSGQECLVHLKKMQHIEQVPVIIYSTSSNEEDFIRTKQLGASNFLVKPSSITSLLDNIQKIICGKNLPFLLNEE